MMDHDYDYRAQAMSPSVVSSSPPPSPPPPPPPTAPKTDAFGFVIHDIDEAAAQYDDAVASDEALLDLAQLEELHQEAERMKAVGNKHMAAQVRIFVFSLGTAASIYSLFVLQEYMRAYNAYSAALQLSPVGPSSHVFLSNRAAALLSLKRYDAAALDAKRSIALAPTFGKAHARLGQALYFLRDYEAAVEAYQDSLQYEPSNAVTIQYLEKAKIKRDKKAAKKNITPAATASTDHSVTTATVAGPFSVVTNDSRGVVNTLYHGDSQAMQKAIQKETAAPMAQRTSAATASPWNANNVTPPSMDSKPTGGTSVGGSTVNEYDPDFEEAVRIQDRAHRYLATKQYKLAIEEFTAALFLVPDDVNLSSDLHMGRAHALNGSRRHESAKNDAVLAVKLNPSPAAYSTLAKSLFYMHQYRESIEAFIKCRDALKATGETLGVFDQAYMQKAQLALEEEEASLRTAGIPTPKPTSWAAATTPVPKLPPPRFVAREEAIKTTMAVRSMPKDWPQQSLVAPATLRCGPERTCVFFTDSLGVKLNRGSDGMVRVLHVVPATAASPVLRGGEDILVGDLIREAAGIDLRRPITNVMWGDTVALIKMAPRPVSLVVAAELSEIMPVRKEGGAAPS
jgi:tetratricopeptide (TPR) repeat protein